MNFSTPSAILFYFLLIKSAEGHDLQPEKNFNGMKSVCYYAYSPESISPVNIDSNMCTHAVYSFASLSEDLTVQSIENWYGETEQYKKIMFHRRSNVKILIQIIPILPEMVPEFIRNETARTKFITSVYEFVVNKAFDGMEFRWYEPFCEEDNCEESFVRLMRELSEKLELKKKLLSLVLPKSIKEIDSFYDVPALSNFLDWFTIVALDKSELAITETRHFASLYYHPEDRDNTSNTNYTVNYILDKGVAPSKCVIMVPFFGVATILNSSRTETVLHSPINQDFLRAEFIHYYEICNLIKHQNWKVVEDPDGRMGPYAYKGDKWVSYDDIAIIRRKVQFAKDLGLGGIGSASVGEDDANNLCGDGNFPLLRTVVGEMMYNGHSNLFYFEVFLAANVLLGVLANGAAIVYNHLKSRRQKDRTAGEDDLEEATCLQTLNANENDTQIE